MKSLFPYLVLCVALIASFATLFEPFRLLHPDGRTARLLRTAFGLVGDLLMPIGRGLVPGQAGLLFQRINRSSPEKIFVVVKNNYSTAAITVGQCVQWDFTGAADGVGVTRPTARATNAGMATCGAVAETTIAAAGYGLIQVYGYNSALRVRNVTTGSPIMVAGSPLFANVAGSVFCFENGSTASTVILKFPCGFAITASAGFTTAVRAGFLKCL